MSEQPTSKDPKIPLGRRAASEAVGTFLLVFIVGSAGAWAKIAAPGPAQPRTLPDLVFLGLSNGFALFFIIMIVGKISGVQVNPAVTISLATVGRFPWKEVGPYIAAQICGAILGAAAELLIFGEAAATRGHLGAASLAPGVSLGQGFLVEGLGTAILLLSIMANAEDPRSPSGWASFAIGMTLAALVMVLAPATGAAINPARAVGPDLVGMFFRVPVNWLALAICYGAAPALGGMLAACGYGYLARLPRQEPDSPGEHEPQQQQRRQTQPARS